MVVGITNYLNEDIENGNFIYNKKEILGKVKVKKGEKLNIDFLPKEGWTLVIKNSMPGSIWYAWYAPKNVMFKLYKRKIPSL